MTCLLSPSSDVAGGAREGSYSPGDAGMAGSAARALLRRSPSLGALERPRSASRGRSRPVEGSATGGGYSPSSPSRGSVSGVAGDRKFLAETFGAFCGAHADMDLHGFTKLCRHCFLLSKRFTRIDAGLAFAAVVPEGQQRINLEQFDAALVLAAEKKGVDVDIIRRSMVLSAGPALQATRTATGGVRVTRLNVELPRTPVKGDRRRSEADEIALKLKAQAALNVALFQTEDETHDFLPEEIDAAKQRACEALMAALLPEEVEARLQLSAEDMEDAKDAADNLS